MTLFLRELTLARLWLHFCAIIHKQELSWMLRTIMDGRLFSRHLHMVMVMSWVCYWMKVSTYTSIQWNRHLRELHGDHFLLFSIFYSFWQQNFADFSSLSFSNEYRLLSALFARIWAGKMTLAWRSFFVYCDSKKGAQVNIQDNNGLTPLMLASYWDNADVVSLLLGAGQYRHTVK